MRLVETMPRKLPRYCVEDVDRYGNIRVYLRRKGEPKIRIEGVPWSEAFMRDYHGFLEHRPSTKAVEAGRVIPQTWRWLCHQYFASHAFKKGLDASTSTRRRAVLELTFLEPTKPGAKTLYGDCPIGLLTPVAVRVLRDRKSVTSRDGANAWLKAIRAVFKWANSPGVELATHNPARDVPPIQIATNGHHPWSVGEVRQFIKRHPIGTKAYLALCLLMFGGGRRSDIVLFGHQHMRGGWLSYTQHKGRKAKPMHMGVPILPALRTAIKACPSQQLTFLVTSFDKPFTSNGFGNWFKDRCVEAGLPHCSAHGVRKAGATLAAENGATTKQLMAMFGWRSEAMAELYTRQAEQKRLALAAMHLIDFDRPDVPLELALSTELDNGENNSIRLVS